MTPAIWTELDDDRSAFEEAMDVADVALRRIQAEHGKLRSTIEALAGIGKAERQACLTQLDNIEALLETPPVTRWRQQHSEGRGRRHSQQHVLERKLAVARTLLAGCGVNLDLVRVPHDGPGQGDGRPEHVRIATPDLFPHLRTTAAPSTRRLL